MHEETKNNALSSVNGTIFPALKKTWVKLYSFSIDCQPQFTKTQGTFRAWLHKNPRDFLPQLGISRADSSMKTRLGVDEIPLLGRRCEIRRGRVKSPQLARAAVKSSALAGKW